VTKSERKASSARVDRFQDLAKVMWLVAALRVSHSLTTPATAASSPGDQLLASTILLIGHGFVYRYGALMRRKKGAIPYLFIQATLAASIALFSLSLWVTIVVFGALAAHGFVLLRAALLDGGRKPR
jgi:hypothetical protein